MKNFSRIVGVSAEDEALTQVIAASLQDPAALAAVHGSSLPGISGSGQGVQGTSDATGLAGAFGNEDAELEAAIAASLGQSIPNTTANGGAVPSGDDEMMDEVAIVGARLGGAADGELAAPDAAAAAAAKGVYSKDPRRSQ
jgi:hypothetical protein